MYLYYQKSNILQCLAHVWFTSLYLLVIPHGAVPHLALGKFSSCYLPSSSVTKGGQSPCFGGHSGSSVCVTKGGQSPCFGGHSGSSMCVTKGGQSPCFDGHSGSSGSESNTLAHMPRHRIAVGTRAHQSVHNCAMQKLRMISVPNFECRFQCFILGVGIRSERGLRRVCVCVCVCGIILNWSDSMLVYNKVKSIRLAHTQFQCLVTFQLLVVQNIIIFRYTDPFSLVSVLFMKSI